MNEVRWFAPPAPSGGRAARPCSSHKDAVFPPGRVYTLTAEFAKIAAQRPGLLGREKRVFLLEVK